MLRTKKDHEFTNTVLRRCFDTARLDPKVSMQESPVFTE